MRSNHFSYATIPVLSVVWLALGAGSGTLACGQNTAPSKATMTQHAAGSFDVKLTPRAPDDPNAEAAVPARMSIDKQFHGDLEAGSLGQMLSAGTGVRGSAGYVAMERVSGKLHGRSGTFILQHTGTMNCGTPQLSITVVPDSGTAELTGLTGRMTIEIVEGKHLYEFEYTITGTP